MFYSYSSKTIRINMIIELLALVLLISPTRSQLCQRSESSNFYFITIPESTAEQIANERPGDDIEINGNPNPDMDPNIKLKLQSMSFSAFSPSEFFSLTYIGATAKIVLIKSIDREGNIQNNPADDITEAYQFDLLCESVDGKTSKKYGVYVQITDRNDITPVFQMPKYEIEVDELMAVGSIIFSGIQAEDYDLDENGDIDYSIKSFSDPPRDGSKYFELVTPKKGDIKVKNKLDYESILSPEKSYLLVIEASDNANNASERLTATTTVTVTVTDADDLGPNFVATTTRLECGTVSSGVCVDPIYYADIFRDQKPNPAEAIAVLKAEDRDTGLGRKADPNYKILGAEPTQCKSFFLMDENNGEIKQDRSIGRDDINNSDECILYIEANGRDDHEILAFAKIVISVLPQDRNLPEFQNEPYVGQIWENPTQQYVTKKDSEELLKIWAIDPDDDLFDEKTQIIYTLRPNIYFMLTSEGYLKVSSPKAANLLDYEAINTKILLTIDANQKNKVAKQTAQIEITLLPVNEFSPVFDTTLYKKNLAESRDTGFSSIGAVEAKDMDRNSHPHGIVNYEITSVTNNGMSKFEIDSKSGDLSFKYPADRGESYAVVVAARNADGKSDYCTVEVNFFPGFNIGPAFEASVTEITLSESTKRGTKIFQLKANDPDSADNIEYEIVTGNDNGIFVIDSFDKKERFLTLVKNLDFETDRQHDLLIKASDGVLEDEFKLIVFVTDTNDNAPVFSKNNYEFTIAEDAPITRQVGRTAATDIDSNNNGVIIYEIDKTNVPFRISQTGHIYITRQLDYENEKIYDFIVRANDGGENSYLSTASVTVFVKDISDTLPQFVNNYYSGDISENLRKGAETIAVVSAVDPDTVPEITYKILAGAASSFEIDRTSGKITAVRSFDYEKDPTINFLLVGIEENPSATATVEINILDTNDLPPVFQKDSYSGSCREYDPPGKLLTTVKAVDLDSITDEITYEFSNLNPDPGLELFFIQSTTGKIRIRKNLNGQGGKAFTLTVVANDNGDPPLNGTVDVLIKVDAVPEGPVFLKNPPEYSVDVPQELLVPRVVTSVKAEDNFAIGIVNYKLDGTPEALPFFVISRTTGDVSLVKSVKAEETTSYVLYVRSYDSGATGRASIAILTVNIIRNRNRPVFPQAGAELQKSISEATPIGSIIFHLPATDLDTGDSGVLRYKLTGNKDSLEYFYANQESAEIILKSSLTRDKSVFFQIILTATDMGKPQLSASVTCTLIVKRNENSPRFVPFDRPPVNIKEDIDKDAFVAVMYATDDDNDNVIYSLSGDGNALEYFKIDNVTGRIEVKKDLLLDTSRLYRLRVRASDDGDIPKSTETVLTVDVNRNPNPPTITKAFYTANLDEHDALKTEVATVSANDPDRGKSGEIYYGIIKEGTSHQYFFIHPDTGLIILAKSLASDPAKLSEYRFDVLASDRGNPAKTAIAKVIVNVNRNEFSPIFEKTRYSISVKETVGYFTPLVTVSATDNDAVGPNKVVNYYLQGAVPESGLELFQIDPRNGLIFIKKPLTSTGDFRFILSVLAKDTGIPSRSSTTEVEIKVERSPDKSPSFAKPYTDLDVSEKISIGSVILRLDVLNRPVTPGKQVRCVFISGNDAGHFWLERRDDDACELILISALDREMEEEFELEIGVSEEGIVSGRTGESRRRRAVDEFSKTVVRITLQDFNDFEPTFVLESPSSPTLLRNRFFAAVDRYAAPFTHVITMEARDDDAGSNGRLVFGWSTSTPAADAMFFRIDKDSGKIETKKEFVGFEGDQFKLMLEVNDNPSPPIELNGAPKIGRAELIVNLIDDERRLVIPIHGKTPEQVWASRDDLVRELEAELGKLVGIESIRTRRYLDAEEQRVIDSASSDVVFYVVNPDTESIEDASDVQTVIDDDKVREILTPLVGEQPETEKILRRPLPVVEREIFLRNYERADTITWPIMVGLASAIAFISFIGIIFACRNYNGYKKFKDQTMQRYMQAANFLPPFYKEQAFRLRLTEAGDLDNLDNYELEPSRPRSALTGAAASTIPRPQPPENPVYREVRRLNDRRQRNPIFLDDFEPYSQSTRRITERY